MNFDTSKVRRIDPEIPKWDTSGSWLADIVGFFLWLLLLIVFVFMIYCTWFVHALDNILKLWKHKPYKIPLWFAVLCCIFFFPATLVIILVGTLVKIIRD